MLDKKWKNSPWVWQAVISNQIIIAKLVVDVLGDHFAEETRCEVVEEKMKRVENKEFLELISDSRPAQQEAIMADEDLVVVSAGAGTGKTETLARRYAWLVTGRTATEQGEKRVRSLLEALQQVPPPDDFGTVVPGGIRIDPQSGAVMSSIFDIRCRLAPRRFP
mgnify:CR=1 FL=1